MQWQGQREKEQNKAQEHDRLACYCLYLMLTEEERTCWMMDLLSPNITQVIKFNDDLLVIIEDCFKRVIQIDQHLALIREKESKEDEASDKQSSQGKK